MIFVPDEMKEQLINDIKEGKIWGLRLIKTPTEVIRDNSYAMMFNIVREISGFDEEKFFLRTKRNVPCYIDYKNYEYQKPNGYVSTDECYEAEAYFQAFEYYDGDILRSTQYFPSCINKEDQVQIIEYEVLRSY